MEQKDLYSSFFFRYINFFDWTDIGLVDGWHRG